MVDITVIRGDGLSRGDDIQDALLTDLSAALSRGQKELDDGALADEMTLECVLSDQRLGRLVEVDDSVLGTWRGKITGVSHKISMDDNGNISASTTINLRKPR